MRWLSFFFIPFFLIACRSSLPPGEMTLNYIEYNRGLSFPTHANLRITSASSDLYFHNLYLDDRSFYPDDIIFPVAIIQPLLELRLGDALKAFTEPYYGVRFYHFFKKNPRIGIGIDFIHFKVFLADYNQLVDITEKQGGTETTRKAAVGQYLDFFNISHGVNHVSLTLVYRLMLLKNSRIPDGRLQPFASIGFGPAVPHLELWTVSNGVIEKKADSYQLGFPNLGFGAGLGVRFKISPGFGFYGEYKFTYSLLNDMFFDTGGEGKVKTSFVDHHLIWGISFIF